ncbi:hypothetical protein [Dethiothermospora halolimnae]|uniref:hypothetical protein n=1 Tax=Dethiothermospora halolimnae TaxID=3114390 RepID=UPI003CCBE545
MLEIPEAINISRQVKDNVYGKTIVNVIANHSPHKFAWYHGDPENYGDLLKGKVVGNIESFGGIVEIRVEDAIILLGDGVNIRYQNKGERRPKKHQLLIEFDDSSSMTGSVQMYGGLWCFKEGEFDNKYYDIAKEKPSPLSEEFDMEYFHNLISLDDVQRLSAKGFLATEQRIPGLGNGVLQDILYNAKIHPKRKIKTLSKTEKENIFLSIKDTLKEMVEKGGRDTEKDLYNKYGGYKTKVSRKTVNNPCPRCGSIIKKATYQGGSIYYCEECQKLVK